MNLGADIQAEEAPGPDGKPRVKDEDDWVATHIGRRDYSHCDAARADMQPHNQKGTPSLRYRTLAIPLLFPPNPDRKLA